MRLFIDVVGAEDGKSWETFEYMLNRETPTADKATLEKSTGGWNWEKAAEVSYSVNGDTMVVTIPRAALGIGEGDFTVNFKWSDNMQTDGDVMDFYTNGDVAPGARYKYSFTTVGVTAPDTETEPADSDTTATPDTETPTEAPTDPADPPKKKGCKSVIPAAILPVVLTAAVAVTKKGKKKEEL